MSDFIIFSIAVSDYALEVSKIDRIDQIPKLTPIPNAHPFIDGMMSYQDNTLKVVRFSKNDRSQERRTPFESPKNFSFIVQTEDFLRLK